MSSSNWSRETGLHIQKYVISNHKWITPFKNYMVCYFSITSFILRWNTHVYIGWFSLEMQRSPKLAIQSSWSHDCRTCNKRWRQMALIRAVSVRCLKYAFVISNLIFTIPYLNKWLLPLSKSSNQCSNGMFYQALIWRGLHGGNCWFKAVLL